MRSVRNKAAAGAFAAILAAGAFAAPSVEITNVQQQYPWTNTVDITYTVQGVNKTHQTNRLDHIVNDTYFATFEAKSGSTPIADVNGNTIFTNGLVQGNGTFTAQWHPAMDQQLTGCTMTPSVFRGEENAYLVIDLETNKQGKCDWWYEPMSTQEESNKRYNSNLYKTRYLVLRRVPAGTHKIGHASDADNPVHDVAVNSDFYIGVFLLTKSQYAKIMGTTPSSNMEAMSRISWNTIRGGASSPSKPTSGVMAELNEKCGFTSEDPLKGFDLPTFSMWEIAARADTCNTIYLSGDTYDNASVDAYFWHRSNGNSEHVVGLKRPNFWGIYDLCSYYDFCRDTSVSGLLSTLQPIAHIPFGTSGASMVFAGYSFTDLPVHHRISARSTQSKSGMWNNVSFRIAYLP